MIDVEKALAGRFQHRLNLICSPLSTPPVLNGDLGPESDKISRKIAHLTDCQGRNLILRKT
jgi:hypothetical protein